MVLRNWLDPRDYDFTQDLDAGQWAWEFLRRNPGYRQEWAAFMAVWAQLESAYGRPPERDFCAWKADPRAWVKVADCPEGDCRVDQDKVLIECALGARWGFYKFPPDPADDDPVGGGRLAWRELVQEVPVVGAGDAEWLGGDLARVALGFDLSVPLRDQVERAKRKLQMLQRQRRRSGELLILADAPRRAQLMRMLRLLDAEAAGTDASRMQAIDLDWQAQLAEAKQLCGGGYRGLLVQGN